MIRGCCLPIFIASIYCHFLTSAHTSSAEEFAKMIEANIVIKDYSKAFEISELGMKIFPQDIVLKDLSIRSLALADHPRKALKLYQESREINSLNLHKDFDLIEDLAWSMLLNQKDSTELVKLIALSGALHTSDSRALKLLIESLDSSNFAIRLAAAKYGAYFPDQIVKEKLYEKLKSETKAEVRVALIRSVAMLKMDNALGLLKGLLQTKNLSSMEESACIEAILRIKENFTISEIEYFSKNKSIGLRSLALHYLFYYGDSKDSSLIFAFLKDPVLEIQLQAIGAIGSMNLDFSLYPETHTLLKEYMQCDNVYLSTAASWLLLQCGEKMAIEGLRKGILSGSNKVKQFTAGYIASGGMKSYSLMEECFKNQEDPYIKATMALSMIKLNHKEKEAIDYLCHFVAHHKEKIQEDHISFFDGTIILPTKALHHHITHQYPEMIDQMTRLNLLNTLCIVEAKQAVGLTKDLLKKSVWGVAGNAAVLLLGESDVDAVEMIRTMLNDKDEAISLQAALALAFFAKDNTGLDRLIEGYSKVNFETKMYILEALGNIGDRKALPFLLKTMGEPFEILTKIAAASVILCLYH